MALQSLLQTVALTSVILQRGCTCWRILCMNSAEAMALQSLLQIVALTSVILHCVRACWRIL